MPYILTLGLLVFLSTGCVGFVSGPNAGYYRGGGGIGLFVIIVALGLIFGKRKR